MIMLSQMVNSKLITMTKTNNKTRKRVKTRWSLLSPKLMAFLINIVSFVITSSSFGRTSAWVNKIEKSMTYRDLWDSSWVSYIIRISNWVSLSKNFKELDQISVCTILKFIRSTFYAVWIFGVIYSACEFT